MNTLPTQVPPPPPAPVAPDEVPTWHELRDRFADLMKDIGTELRELWSHEGKELREVASARAMPALRRARAELDKLITRLEQRLAKEPPVPPR
jgi:hypothetical protein